MKNPKISKIEITKLEWSIRDCSIDEATNIVTYKPGSSFPMCEYMTRMHTDAGVIGEYAVPVDISCVRDFLIGRDALVREPIFHQLRFQPPKVRGAIDILLWDIAGKVADMSISQLLGGHRKRLPAYASTMNGAIEGLSGGLSTPESFADFAQQCLELGYPGFKIHPSPCSDIKNHVDTIHALGERVGGKMDLMLDAFCCYPTFADALRAGYACDEAGFFWYEDPYFEGGISELGHRRLRELIQTPLLQGEKIAGLTGKTNLLTSGATDFIRGDITTDGITGTMKMAAVAEAAGTDIELHGCGPAQRHVMSAISNSNYYEVVWVHPDTECMQSLTSIFGEGYKDGLEDIEADGTVLVPEGPGMGVVYDQDAINKYKTATKLLD